MTETKRSFESPGEEVLRHRAELFHQYRGLLFSIAYRMLGSVADAEDIVQESFIRWQRSADEEILSPRAYLVTIVSRLCLNHLHSAKRQREDYVGQWLPEPLMTGPGSDPLESVRVDESLQWLFWCCWKGLSLSSALSSFFV